MVAIVCHWKESFYHLSLYNREKSLVVIQSIWNSPMDFMSTKQKTIGLITEGIFNT